MKGRVWRVGLTPSLFLLLLTGTIAAAINHFVAPESSDRAFRPGFGSSQIRIGPLDYPRRAIDSDSFVVHTARTSRRIVSQHWAVDEYVYSVVPAEHVVAVSQSAYERTMSNVYAQVEKYHPVIATDPERVLGLDPDLLMVSNTSREDFCALIRTAQIPIYRMFTTFSTLGQIADGIRLTGYLTGEDRTAEREVAQFWSDINRAKAKRPSNAGSPRILGFGGRYSYGSGTLFNDIVRTLGGINVGAEGGLRGYDEINSERIVDWNPEWIVAGADKGRTREVLTHLLGDPAIALTQAARSGHIVVLENQVFLPTSPYTRLLVTALAEAIYG